MAEYNVRVIVTEIPGTTPGYSIVVSPERLALDGKEGNSIIWSMLVGSVGTFKAASDIEFVTNRGRERFPDPTFADGRITVAVNGREEDETIYVYALTVHVGEGEHEQMIRIDPEVDNPPPPATGPPAPPLSR